MIGSVSGNLIENGRFPALLGAQLVQNRDRMFSLKILNYFHRCGRSVWSQFFFRYQTFFVHFYIKRQRLQRSYENKYIKITVIIFEIIVLKITFFVSTQSLTRLPAHLLQQFHTNPTGYRCSSTKLISLHPRLFKRK